MTSGATVSDWSDEETADPHYADRRNFYKVEKWSRDGLRVELMLYAGSSLDKARRIFERARQAPAARPADRPPAHARVRRVAAARNDPVSCAAYREMQLLQRPDNSGIVQAWGLGLNGNDSFGGTEGLTGL